MPRTERAGSEQLSALGKVVKDALSNNSVTGWLLRILLIALFLAQIPGVLDAGSDIYHRFRDSDLLYQQVLLAVLGTVFALVVLVVAATAIGWVMSLVLYLPFGAVTQKNLDRQVDALISILESTASSEPKLVTALAQAKQLRSLRRDSLSGRLIRFLVKGRKSASTARRQSKSK